MRITEKRFYRIRHAALTPVTIKVLPSAKEIARKYKISHATVHKIKNSPTYEYYKDYDAQRTIAQIKDAKWGEE